MSRRSGADWLWLIRSAAEDSVRVRLTRHARLRMQERNVAMREVLNVLRRGIFEEAPAPVLHPLGHWMAKLVDRNGIGVVVGFDHGRCPSCSTW